MIFFLSFSIQITDIDVEDPTAIAIINVTPVPPAPLHTVQYRNASDDPWRDITEMVTHSSSVSTIFFGFPPLRLLSLFLTFPQHHIGSSTSVRVRPLFYYFYLFFDAIVLATDQVIFAGFVFSQFLSDFENKHTAAKVL